MTSRYETEINLEKKSTRHLGQPVPASSEAAYDRLTGYGFARRYVGGKIVADIGREELGYGSRLLAETAKSVAGLADSHEAVDLASAVYSAPNVSYRRVALSELPYPEGYFDVVVALGVIDNLEYPEDLVAEVKRVLKGDGTLIISALDKQTYTNDREGIDGRRRMYVIEFRELLERHFGQVQVYRQGVVAGGFVFPVSEKVTGAPVEIARPSLTSPHFTTEPPTTRSIIAVCSDAEALGKEERPYLLLDRDRRVFDECEERAEDVELMRAEIQRMQETEVQVFADTLRTYQSLTYVLPRLLPRLARIYLRHRRNTIYGNIYAIRKKGVRGTARGAFRRLSSPYRRLRAKNRNSD